jgi:hypothetical protein
MAAKESQSIQVALIITFILTVGLGVTTFTFWKKTETAADAKKTAEAESAKHKRAFAIENYKSLAYLYMLGDASDKKPNRTDLTEHRLRLEQKYPENRADLDTIEKRLEMFDKDMATYAYDIPEAERGYRNIPDRLEKAIRSKNSAYIAERDRATSLKKDYEERLVTETKSAQDANQKLTQARGEVSSEIQKYGDERKRINSEKESQRASFAASVSQLTASNQKDKNEIVGLTKRVDMMADTLAVRRSKDERRSKFFEVADGRITLVNDRKRTVWINLGLADGLRELTTFGVYDLQEDGVMRNEKEIKARIQVTKVLDQHLSEARITEEELQDPILPGDQIHSPAWQPGTRIHFALAGFFDVNGDGTSDREIIRNMVASVGGIIDAEVHDDGSKTGRITANTRYVIKANPDKLGGAKGYNDLMREIQFHDVEQISLESFLNYVGWKQETYWVTLGRGADPKDFIRGLTEREKPATLSNESFRQRMPLKTPGRGDDGAF